MTKILFFSKSRLKRILPPPSPILHRPLIPPTFNHLSLFTSFLLFHSRATPSLFARPRSRVFSSRAEHSFFTSTTNKAYRNRNIFPSVYFNPASTQPPSSHVFLAINSRLLVVVSNHQPRPLIHHSRPFRLPFLLSRQKKGEREKNTENSDPRN